MGGASTRIVHVAHTAHTAQVATWTDHQTVSDALRRAAASRRAPAVARQPGAQDRGQASEGLLLRRELPLLARAAAPRVGAGARLPERRVLSCTPSRFELHTLHPKFKQPGLRLGLGAVATATH